MSDITATDEKQSMDISKRAPHVHAAPHDLLEAMEGGVIHEGTYTDIPAPNTFQRYVNKLESLAGVEARGIERVTEEERVTKTRLADYLQMALIWFSSNITANNLTVGLLGPAAFYVGLRDAMIIAAFGSFVGSVGTGYISTFGPMSGNRTLVYVDPWVSSALTLRSSEDVM